MSAENGIGTAGRLYPVEDSSGTVAGLRVSWPKGVRIPFPRIKKHAESVGSGRNWSSIGSTLGEIAGIAAISVGCGWYSPAIGLISGGIGIFAISFVAGIPSPSVGPEKR